MSEETVTNHPADNNGSTNTTVIREKSGSGAGIVMAVVLLIAVIGGIYLFSRSSDSESAKDNAVAEAAKDVGNAASQVGKAAQTAADNAANEANK